MSFHLHSTIEDRISDTIHVLVLNVQTPLSLTEACSRFESDVDLIQNATDEMCRFVGKNQDAQSFASARMGFSNSDPRWRYKEMTVNGVLDSVTSKCCWVNNLSIAAVWAHELRSR